jgi:hypothetical protein
VPPPTERTDDCSVFRRTLTKRTKHRIIIAGRKPMASTRKNSDWSQAAFLAARLAGAFLAAALGAALGAGAGWKISIISPAKSR